MKRNFRKWLRFSSLGIIATLSTSVFASGYKLEFQSVSVLADAGDAAVVEDAGTNWYNSAGLVYLPQQLVGSAIDVYQHVTFRGTSIAPSAFGSSFIGTGKATSHPNSILPAFHYALPLSDRFAFGLSALPAWGLKENYGVNSILRYDLIRIYTKTMDIAPSLAMKINEHWSVGAGPDFNYFALQSNNNSRTQIATPSDSMSRVSADNWGYGAHAGILYRYSDTTRIGLNYRTRIVMDLKGYSSFTWYNNPFLETNQFRFRIPLPPTTSFSVYHDMTPT